MPLSVLPNDEQSARAACAAPTHRHLPLASTRSRARRRDRPAAQDDEGGTEADQAGCQGVGLDRIVEGEGDGRLNDRPCQDRRDISPDPFHELLLPRGDDICQGLPQDDEIHEKHDREQQEQASAPAETLLHRTIREHEGQCDGKDADRGCGQTREIFQVPQIGVLPAGGG